MEYPKNAIEADEIEKHLKKHKLYRIYKDCWSFFWFEFIDKNKEKGWNYTSFSKNPNVTWNLIKYYKKSKWNRNDICLNPNLTYEDVKEIIILNKYFKPSLNTLMNPDKTLVDKTGPYIDVSVFGFNENLTLDLIKENPYKIPFDYKYISLNPNITEDFIRENINKNWDYTYLSMNPNVSWKIVNEFSNKQWNYEELSKNPNITWDIIKNNPDKPWNIKSFSLNKNMTFEIFEQNKNLDWDFYNLSKKKIFHLIILLKIN